MPGKSFTAEMQPNLWIFLNLTRVNTCLNCLRKTPQNPEPERELPRPAPPRPAPLRGPARTGFLTARTVVCACALERRKRGCGRVAGRAEAVHRGRFRDAKPCGCPPSRCALPEPPGASASPCRAATWPAGSRATWPRVRSGGRRAVRAPLGAGEQRGRSGAGLPAAVWQRCRSSVVVCPVSESPVLPQVWPCAAG